MFSNVSVLFQIRLTSRKVTLKVIRCNFTYHIVKNYHSWLALKKKLIFPRIFCYLFYFGEIVLLYSHKNILLFDLFEAKKMSLINPVIDRVVCIAVIVLGVIELIYSVKYAKTIFTKGTNNAFSLIAVVFAFFFGFALLGTGVSGFFQLFF